MDLNEDIRWKQRFQNFGRAFSLLRSIAESKSAEDFSDEECELIVGRFIFTFELAWKTLKDYLEYEGLKLTEASPRKVIKECAESGIFDAAETDAQVFIDMLEARNVMAHSYDYEKFKKITADIVGDYTRELDKIYFYFLSKVVE
ncbi:MAG: nucleotidyltransferase substrate binding protein [Oscillospiraceae bacterium]|nr:nucleotidyltransferase substrate binding protein [Oscillospiraceae bacterium]